MVLLTVTPAIKTALELYHSQNNDNNTSDQISPDLSNDQNPTIKTKPTHNVSSTTTLDTTSEKISANIKQQSSTTLLPPTSSPSISHAQLITLASKTCTPLVSLVRNSAVYTPPPPPPPAKSPEYIALMSRLRREAEEAEYMEMVGGAAPASSLQEVLTPGQEIKAVREQLTAIVNVGISVASVAYALWYCSGNYFHWDLPARTLLALFGAIVVLVAETVVYLRYHMRVDDARAVEQAKVEKKTFLQALTGPEGVLALPSDDIDLLPAVSTTTSTSTPKPSTRKRRVASKKQ
ncbi:uncharacterized protein SAPINGB_P003567 [Magnusiomyces paraingens]|uniref:Uncharacterized protein n=1 Tax=Magnusiomyces paraingens TaxID=2606893 RepID=A0A5E8BXG6_9ASCO|nr:uncharacterized protein SAPINGB_P003567 [Saprochaete ingens]VVT53425.1 unnamed protein product [Saprochaete ingens]